MKNNMKNLRTNCYKKIDVWFFLIFLNISIGCFNIVKSEENPKENAKNLVIESDQHLRKFQVKSVREVKINDNNVTADNDTITYQNYNSPDFKLFLINGTGFKPADKLTLIPVKSNSSCDKSHQLNVISVVKNHQHNENLLFLKIYSKQLENLQKIYLCAYEENSYGHGKHLGETSLFIMIE